MPLISPDASPGELAEGVFELKESERTIVFHDVPRRPALSFLRGFSAPVRVEDDLTEDDLVVLSRRDSDNFNRWQALQSLATRVLLRGVKAIRAGRPPERNAGLVAAFGALIEDARARTARSGFRDARDDAAERGGHCARNRRGRRSGRDLCARGRRCGARSAARTATPSSNCTGSSPIRRRSAPTRPRPAGERCATAALALFVDGNVIDGLALAHRPAARSRQHDGTPRRARGDRPQARAPRANTRSTHSAGGTPMEPLILDKWFALQAQIPERETLERVRGADEPPRLLDVQPEPGARADRRILGQPYAIQPGRRSRVCAARGGGASTLDPTNPQIAARLLTAMRSWRSLEDERRRQAEAMLRRIAAQPTLSPDVRDIVTRSLG